MTVEQLLPLVNHAQNTVMQQHNLHINIIISHGSQLLNIHHNGAVTGKDYNPLAGLSQLSAHSGGQAVAHGSQATGGQELTGLAAVKELGSPHLVLSYVGYHDGIIIHQVRNLLNQLLGQNSCCVVFISKGMLLIHSNNMLAPFSNMTFKVVQRTNHQVQENRHGPTQIAEDRIVHRNIFVDFRFINLEMHDFSIGSKGAELAGDTVVEACAQGNQQIAFLHRHIGCVGAVHTHHAEEALVGGGNAAQAHERANYRNGAHLNNLAEKLALSGQGHAAANKEQRTLGIFNGLHYSHNLFLITGEFAAIAPQIDGFRIFIFKLRREYILSNIDYHRTGTTCSSDKKGLFNNPRQLLRLFYQIIMLGNRSGNTHNIGLLEGILTDIGIAHLTGKAHHRNGVHVRRSDTGNQICCARAGGSKAHAHLAGGSSVAISGVYCTLLMASQNMGKFSLVNCII